jgi:hypothetical protein
MGRGSTRPRGGGGESHRSQISVPRQPEICKNGEKKGGGFSHFLSSKSPKMLFFAKKYLTRYNPETFFEEFINSKFFTT